MGSDIVEGPVVWHAKILLQLSSCRYGPTPVLVQSVIKRYTVLVQSLIKRYIPWNALAI